MKNHSTTENLRSYFILCLAAGVIGIVAGWLLEETFGRTLAMAATVAVPLLGMAGYVYVGVTGDDTLASTDVFADSIYYLGFLLTLVALIFSLFSIASSAEGMSGLVFRFGVALSTTVVGLACRTYFSTFRATAKDEFSRLEAELTGSIRSVRGRLHNLSDLMNLQANAFQANLQKVNDDLKYAAEEIQAATARLGGAVDQSVMVIDESSDGLQHGTTRFARQLNDTMNEISSRLDVTAKVLSGKVGEVDLPPDLYTKQFAGPAAEYAAKLKELTEGVRDHAAALKDLEANNRQLISAVSDTSQQLGDASSESADRIGRASGMLNSLIEQLGTMSEQMEGIAASFEKHEVAVAGTLETSQRMRDELAEDTMLSKRHREALEEELSRSRTALIKMRGELVEAAEYIHDELKA